MSPGRTSIDRWFFTAVAGLFFVVAFVGFGPNSLAILSGSMENPNVVVHVHAAAMFSWLVLFLVQASLIGSGKTILHARLGRAFIVLGPLIIVLMIYLAFTRFPGGELGPMIVAVQAERILLFSSFLAGAMLIRGKNNAAHKRLILLATLVPLDAAFNRMPWLPGSISLWMVSLLLPLIAYDLWQLGRLHMTTIIGGGCVAFFWIGLFFWML